MRSNIHQIPRSLPSNSGLPTLSEESVAEVLTRLGGGDYIRSTNEVGGLEIITGAVEDAHTLTSLILVPSPVPGCAVVALWKTAPKHQQPRKALLAVDKLQTEFAP
jgi:hypothetical protein